MIDFLTFKTFISIEVLSVFYFIGAMILPFGSWLISMKLINSTDLLSTTYDHINTLTWQRLSKTQKLYVTLFLLFFFLFMELLWRMMFEFLIAFIQMRDALVVGV